MLRAPKETSAVSDPKNGADGATPDPEDVLGRTPPRPADDAPAPGAAPAAADAGGPAPAAADQAGGDDPGGTAVEGAPAEGEALQREVEKLRAELDESQSRARTTQQRLKEEHELLLRTAADFDNFRKRTQKEKDDVRKFAVEALLKDFLPVADNFERALDAAASADPKSIVEGVKLVQKLFEATLQRHGVTGFSAVGSAFDPNLHEALMQQESDAAPGTVVAEMAKGYRLRDRLVRPAAVVVARARPQAPAPEPAAAPSEDAAAGSPDGGGTATDG
jgi:molecular chaperone GrpE